MLSGFRILIGSLLLGLVACSPLSPKDTQQHQVLRACIHQCQRLSMDCQAHCEDSCFACEKRARDTMVKQYNHYVHHQAVQGKRLSLQLQSFRDPLKCRKSSCDCAADYRMCVGDCRGNVRKYLQVTPFCC